MSHHYKEESNGKPREPELKWFEDCWDMLADVFIATLTLPFKIFMEELRKDREPPPATKRRSGRRGG